MSQCPPLAARAHEPRRARERAQRANNGGPGMSQPESVATAGGVTVRIIDSLVRDAAAVALLDAVSADAAARLAEGDPTLWGPEAESEAAIRLGWIDVTVASRALLPRLL